MYIIRIVGLVNGQRSPQDNRFLARFAFVGGPGQMDLEVTDNPTRAMQFKGVLEAMETWKSVDPRAPVRADGRPNRPLTAFTVQVEPLV